MLFSQINPYVRFVGEVVLTESTKTVSTYDHRLLYFTEGECSIIINNLEQKVQAGTVLLWQSGTKYKIMVHKPTRLIAVNFDYTRENDTKNQPISPIKIKNFSKAGIFEHITFLDMPLLNSPLILNQMYEIFQGFEELMQENQKNLMLSDEYCSVIIKKIIITLIRSAMFTTSAVFNKLDKIIAYIENNYSRDISNSEIAEIIGYHPYHINRLMREYTGVTLHQYIIEYRLKKTQEFLINTSFYINEIAELCGFNSAYYFTHIFKQKFGVTPTEYRKNNKNNV